jgi:mitochondrial fission protein ELM1
LQECAELIAVELARPLRIWALLGARHGDNNQVLALAEALGVPFEVKALRYNFLRHLQPPLLGATFRSLSNESRPLVARDWPDLTISAGHRSVPVVQEIRHRSEGRTRSVHVGYPRISPANFDLVVATPEYPIADHPHLVRIPFALTRSVSEGALPGPDFLRAFPAPRRLVILGGPTLYWHLDSADVQEALSSLLAAAAIDGGSVVIVGSARTPDKLLDALHDQIATAKVPATIVRADGPPSYPELLEAAGSIFVSADSVAMVGDAIMTRRPVGLISVRRTGVGRMWMGIMDRLRPGQRVHPRDLRFFWRALREHDLVGTIDEPKLGDVRNPIAIVVNRVRDLLPQLNN